jgi:hypothetical protein
VKASHITYIAIIVALSIHAILLLVALKVVVSEKNTEEEFFVPMEIFELIEEDIAPEPLMHAGEEARNLIANAQSQTSSERASFKKKSNAQLERELMEKYMDLEQEVKNELEAEREENMMPEDDRPEREKLELNDYGWYKETSYEGPVLAKYDLKDRHHNDLKIPGYTCKSSGQVTIEITVDQNGRVVDAKVDGKGTDTKNECLITNAMDFASRSVFNSSSAAPKRQKGTITYKFKKQ